MGVGVEIRFSMTDPELETPEVRAQLDEVERTVNEFTDGDRELLARAAISLFRDVAGVEIEARRCRA